MSALLGISNKRVPSILFLIIKISILSDGTLFCSKESSTLLLNKYVLYYQTKDFTKKI